MYEVLDVAGPLIAYIPRYPSMDRAMVCRSLLVVHKVFLYRVALVGGDGWFVATEKLSNAKAHSSLQCMFLSMYHCAC